MALIKSVRGKKPKFGENCWFAENSTIVGDVTMGKNCTVWFSTVVRGDVESIRIGDDTNIQDGAVIHGTYEKAKTIIGSRVSIGHNAIVHGCTLEDDVLVGMGAIVMDNAVVKSGCIIAAGSVLLAGRVTEPGYIYAGIPAKKVKKVEGELADIFSYTANNYHMCADWFRDEE